MGGSLYYLQHARSCACCSNAGCSVSGCCEGRAPRGGQTIDVSSHSSEVLLGSPAFDAVTFTIFFCHVVLCLVISRGDKEKKKAVVREGASFGDVAFAAGGAVATVAALFGDVDIVLALAVALALRVLWVGLFYIAVHAGAGRSYIAVNARDSLWRYDDDSEAFLLFFFAKAAAAAAGAASASKSESELASPESKHAPPESESAPSESESASSESEPAPSESESASPESESAPSESEPASSRSRHSKQHFIYFQSSPSEAKASRTLSFKFNPAELVGDFNVKVAAVLGEDPARRLVFGGKILRVRHAQ
jgi:hypothetical protein